MSQVTNIFKTGLFEFLTADMIVEPIVMTIKDVQERQFEGRDGPEMRVVMLFTETDKLMRINKTMAGALMEIFKDPNPTTWRGHKIRLHAELIQAFGKTMNTIRINPAGAMPIAQAQNITQEAPFQTPNQAPQQPTEPPVSHQIAGFANSQGVNPLAPEVSQQISQAKTINDLPPQVPANQAPSQPTTSTDIQQSFDTGTDKKDPFNGAFG